MSLNWQYIWEKGPLQDGAVYTDIKVVYTPVVLKFKLSLPLAGTLTLNHTSLISAALITPQLGFGIAGVSVALVQANCFAATQGWPSGSADSIEKNLLCKARRQIGRY